MGYGSCIILLEHRYVQAVMSTNSSWPTSPFLRESDTPLSIFDTWLAMGREHESIASLCVMGYRSTFELDGFCSRERMKRARSLLIHGIFSPPLSRYR